MWLRLAALWGCTVADAQGRCSSREFCEWQAFYRMDPWGPSRDDLRIGILAALYASTKSGRVHSASEFMPYADPPPAQTPEEIVREARRVKTLLAGG